MLWTTPIASKLLPLFTVYRLLFTIYSSSRAKLHNHVKAVEKHVLAHLYRAKKPRLLIVFFMLTFHKNTRYCVDSDENILYIVSHISLEHLTIKPEHSKVHRT